MTVITAADKYVHRLYISFIIITRGLARVAAPTFQISITFAIYMIIVSELKAEMNKKDSDTDKKRTRSESEESEPNKNLLFRGFVKKEDFF